MSSRTRVVRFIIAFAIFDILIVEIAFAGRLHCGKILAAKNASIEYPFQQTASQVAEGAFNQSRSLEQYASALGVEFVDLLQSLSNTSRWIDFGAGEALAMRQLPFLKSINAKKIRRDFYPPWLKPIDDPTQINIELSQSITSRPLPFMTAVSTKIPEEAFTAIKLFENRMAGRFEYLSQKYLQEYTPEELPKANLATDVKGPFIYGDNPGEILRLELGTLKIGGTLIVALPHESDGDGITLDRTRTNLIFLEGTYTEWLRDFRGIEVTTTRESLVLKRISEDFYVPALGVDRIETRNNGAPTRRVRYHPK